MRYSNGKMKTAAEMLAGAELIPLDRSTLYPSADATEPLWCNDCDAPATLACANAGHDCIDSEPQTLWIKGAEE